ncbi:hypothetical protein Bca52824_020317 [Brassica carinata]|uniref:Uncharacterized protein n=1 Tax=Brassica carinata TaxID=52824 RepID=A0A8X7VU68_BRACI|nr:hypothetical protein Bca52824_020317 [Brassica carinata]
MVNALALLSQLQTDRSSSTVEVRLLRFWEARNVRRGGEIMGIDMLLLDSQIIRCLIIAFFFLVFSKSLIIYLFLIHVQIFNNQPFLWIVRPGSILRSDGIETLPNEVSTIVSERGYIMKPKRKRKKKEKICWTVPYLSVKKSLL